MKKIVFVGQTPPPYGGQAIMIEKILCGQYEGVELFHVRMAFSKEMDEIGKASVFKIFHLIEVIVKIFYYRIVENAKILYYPPAGPDKIPVIRDVIILLSTRWLFEKTIFHFHAGGVSEINLKSFFSRFFYKWAYFESDCAILLSELNPRDGKNLKTKKEVIIPYGIEDNYRTTSSKKSDDLRVRILFVGVIKESKGVLILLEACKRLKAKGLDFTLEIMGKFESKEFERIVNDTISKYQIGDKVSFLGVLSGSEKFAVFNSADIFCFPTFFESETFGVVLLEAMQFSLPIVSTIWRGIPSIIKDGDNGFLVKPKDASMLTEKLEVLILNPSLRQRMGSLGRNIFLERYTLKEFQNRMGQIFITC
jgi:glycosyltransferase involved in cell wall biosynthesis